MGLTKNFEDFPVYQKSMDLVAKVFLFLNHSVFKAEIEFNNQLKRAVISITNNIAEGSEYNSNRQFIRFLKIAKGSCAEVRSLILVSKRLKWREDEIQDEIINETKEIS
ncbi:MAG: four helix bundle protein, partial [Cruoricaptor ignavus]|nr:four helix bundle protein [Cruoricaptor ignavus]